MLFLDRALLLNTFAIYALALVPQSSHLQQLTSHHLAAQGVDVASAGPQAESLQDIAGFLQRQDPAHVRYIQGSRLQRSKRQAASTVELLRLLRPCASCARYKRYGSAHSGGFVMCEELLDNISAAYAFSTNGNFDWGETISQTTSAPVFQFDCYRATRPSCSHGSDCQLHVIPECLGLKDDLEPRIFRSLSEHLKQHSPQGNQIPSSGGDFVLKIDVEGKEWNALRDVPISDLQRMRQMVVEFHSLSRVEFHESFVKVLQHIQEAGFRVAHIHGNNLGPMAVFGNGMLRVADILQVTFINKLAPRAAVDATCRKTQHKLPQDAVDNPFNFDLPIPWLAGQYDAIRPSRIPVLKCHWGCSFSIAFLWIGPFVVISTVLAALMILIGLLVTAPKFDARKCNLNKKTLGADTSCATLHVFVRNSITKAIQYLSDLTRFAK